MTKPVPKTQAIVAAAGAGERLRAGKVKALVALNGKPLILYALEVLERCAAVYSVILVTPADSQAEVEALLEQHALTKVKRVIPGGAARADSVRNGMAALDDDTEYVLIHDAARPLIDPALVERIITAAYAGGAAIAAMPVKPTIKQVDPVTMTITATPERRALWEAQTPQVFERALLERARQAAGDTPVTDEAMLVERIGHKVAVVEGSYQNLKVTTSEDLICAEALLRGLSAASSEKGNA